MIDILTTPILELTKVIDTNTDNIIKFNVIGGDQVYGHQVEIYDNSSNILVYEKKTFGFLFQVQLESKKLVNGKEYKVRVRTFNGNVLNDFSNFNGNTSSFSDYLLLKCYTSPVVDIVNFSLDSGNNKMIKNQTYQFIGSYYQVENVPLKSFKYLLYDKNGILIQTFNEVFQLNGELKQEIAGFINEENYFIELITINQYGVTASSGKIKFYVQYIQPRIRQTINVENDYKNASVKVEARIVRVLFEGKDYTYELDDWINLKKGEIWIDEENHISIENDFTLKLWIKNITKDKIFLNLISQQGKIEILLRDNRFHVYKKYNNSDFYSHYASSTIDNYTNDTIFYIFIQQINGMLNIKYEKIL